MGEKIAVVVSAVVADGAHVAGLYVSTCVVVLGVMAVLA